MLIEDTLKARSIWAYPIASGEVAMKPVRSFQDLLSGKYYVVCVTNKGIERSIPFGTDVKFRKDTQGYA